VVEAALSRRGQSSMETGLVARSFWCFYQKKNLSDLEFSA